MKTNQSFRFFRPLLVILFFTLSLGACKKEADPQPKTSLVFWTKRDLVNSVKVDCYVDNQFIGTLTKVTQSAPSCNEPGSLTANFEPGSHVFEFRLATGQTLKIEQEVTAGQCRTLELT